MKPFDLIDFDGKFKDYFDEWLKENRGKFEKVEEIEQVIPSVYEEWSNRQSGYFDQYTGEELVQLLIAYQDSNKDVPDILFNTMLRRKTETELPVYKLFCNNMFPEKVQVLLINLLSDMNSVLPMESHLRVLTQAKQESDTVSAASDALYNMGESIVQPALAAYDKAVSLVGKELLINAIVKYSKDESIYGMLSSLYKETGNKAFVAALMGEYGDERCLKDLYEAEQSKEINYVDYTEICNAIEELGGQTNREREFDNDPYYEFMKQTPED